MIPSLEGLPLGGFRWLEETTSTNDEASTWAEQGAADFSVVAADRQTQGRGRLNRRWITPAGCALAFSVVVRPTPGEMAFLPRFSAWAGLALCATLEQIGLRPELKWPNDVLLERRKTAGILIESNWRGDAIPALIVGIGVNVGRQSVPPADQVQYPATSVESALGKPVERWELFAGLLRAMLDWRERIGEAEFLNAWERRLAFRGEWVQVGAGLEPPRTARITGLAADGSLELISREGEPLSIQVGEVSLRPA